MKDISISNFFAKDNINLKEISTRFNLGEEESVIEKELEHVREELGDLQDVLYAHNKYAVLICLQGMDTSGKDSLIREVFKDFNSRGVVVHSFKVPTELELSHDYLWRHYIALPERGKFAVFNRTHYENVLVTRVHPEYILNENLPNVNSLQDINEDFWERRFKEIKNFENHLVENGTVILKFYLHLSKEEQRQRLLRRLDKKEKNWKFSPGDLKERKLWSAYQSCYEDAISKTSTRQAPWYVIPSDDKMTSRYLVARIIYDTLIEYQDIKEPELPLSIQEKLEEYREQLSRE